MRNTPEPERGTWATFIAAARERARINKTELGRRISKDRATIHRWETGQFRPDDADLVARVAEVLGLDLEETLAAAGLRPGVSAPATPTTQVLDEDELMIVNADVDQRTKELALEQLHRMKLRDMRRRMEDLQFFLDQRRDSA